MQAALSAYNTGSFLSGFRERLRGPKYYGRRRRTRPGWRRAARQSVTAEAVKRAAPPPPPNPYTADTQIYVREVSTLDPVE